MSDQENNYVYYIITVHGIGDQRYNETLVPVINGFAKSRNEELESDLVTLGKINSQTGSIIVSPDDVDFSRRADQTAWAEFESIPIDPSNAKEFFDGSKSNSGDNIRFVDMFWADILDQDAKISSEPVDKWANSLIARNQQKSNGSGHSNSWILKLLGLLTELIVFLNSFLKLRYKKLQDVIFNKYLSDVQVYGEHENVRNAAVSRFHKMMARINQKHEDSGEKRKPRYIIMSHSLGSVLAMDAIVSIHANSKPFNYSYDQSAYQDDWKENIDTLITLGSPIDKYILLWPENYEYLDKDNFKGRTTLIRHINYSDEQDPVGHKLNVFRSSRAYKKVFDGINAVANDEIFNRYPIPGKAHIDYWDDNELLTNLIDNTIDERESFKKIKDKKWAHTKGIIISYFVLPIIATVVMGYFLTLLALELGLEKDEFDPDWNQVFLLSFTFIALAYFFQKIIKLTVFWRVLLISKTLNGGKYVDHTWRNLVKVFRYFIVVVLAFLYFIYTAPVVSKMGWYEILFLIFYLAGLTIGYLIFLVVRKFFIPSTVVVDLKNISSYNTYGYTLLFAILCFVLCQLLYYLTGPLFEVDDLRIAIIIPISCVVWIFNCVCLYIYKRDIRRIVDERDERVRG